MINRLFKKDKYSIHKDNEDIKKYEFLIDDILDEEMGLLECGFINKFTKSEFNNINETHSLNRVLSSFEPHDKLNSNFWDKDMNLDSRIRLQLLDIADDFFESLNISWVKIKDIILTGSICSYTWSQYSDIDLHIIIDFTDVHKNVDFVRNYLTSQKLLWNDAHDSLKIYGYPVELYVQDINDESDFNGVYSLEKDKWIKKPKNDYLTNVKINKKVIKKKSLSFISKLLKIEKEIISETDKVKIKKLFNKLKILWDELKELRKKSLHKEGELSIGNLIYKVIRRCGLLDKFFKLQDLCYDKINSITKK